MNWGKTIAWGKTITWAGIALGIGASIGYLLAGDHRRALYFFLGACITATVAWE